MESTYADAATQKYLFLDLDGPLHPTTTVQGRNVALLASSPNALREAGFFVWADDLEAVLHEAESAHAGQMQINVVVHSAWRAQPWFSTPVIRQALGPLGRRICGFTRTELPRAQAIGELCERMEIADYLVLDDDVQAFADCPEVKLHLLAVHPLQGVRDPQVAAALLQWASADVPRPVRGPTPSTY